jgi:hypothetical protein
MSAAGSPLALLFSTVPAGQTAHCCPPVHLRQPALLLRQQPDLPPQLMFRPLTLYFCCSVHWQNGAGGNAVGLLKHAALASRLLQPAGMV